MDKTHHEFNDLFEQLGLPSDEASIRRFCAEHSLRDDEKLSEADFLTEAQQQFVKDALLADADWVVLIDQLNNALHRLPPADHAEKTKRADAPTPG